MNAELEACNDITAGQADEYHATAGGRVFSWIDGRLGPVGHANLKIMQSTQAGISSPCGNALWTHGTDDGSKFPHRRQNTGLCDHLSCRGGERPHLSNTPSRRITDERDTGFHWALRRGGWGRTPVGNPSLGACLPLLCPSMSCADSLCTYVQFLLPPRGERGIFAACFFSRLFFVSEHPGFSRLPWTGVFPGLVVVVDEVGLNQTFRGFATFSNFQSRSLVAEAPTAPRSPHVQPRQLRTCSCLPRAMP